MLFDMHADMLLILIFRYAQLCRYYYYEISCFITLIDISRMLFSFYFLLIARFSSIFAREARALMQRYLLFTR